MCADQELIAWGSPLSRVKTILAGAITAGVEVGPAYALRGLLSLEHGKINSALADADKAAVS